MIKERPILFNREMVRAILDGRKTQTRRLVNPQPSKESDSVIYNPSNFEPDNGWYWRPHGGFAKCPFGKPGDRLWVRETFQSFDTCPPSGIKQVIYRADNSGFGEYSVDEIIWKPSIHMPHWASRINLEITGVRVERLQDISEEDAIAEGCEYEDGIDDCAGGYPSINGTATFWTAKDCFKDLWQSINGLDSWNQNPWVWVVEFKKI